MADPRGATDMPPPWRVPVLTFWQTLFWKVAVSGAPHKKSWICHCSVLNKVNLVKKNLRNLWKHKYFILDLQPICHNGGTAQESVGVWTCSCTSRFTGTYCETGKLFGVSAPNGIGKTLFVYLYFMMFQQFLTISNSWFSFTVCSFDIKSFILILDFFFEIRSLAARCGRTYKILIYDGFINNIKLFWSDFFFWQCMIYQ